MDERERQAPDAVPARPAPRSRLAPTPAQQRRRRQSVLKYVVILFTAAFVLLLYTFLMDRRQHELTQVESQEQISQLQQNTASATQRLDAIISERDQLKEENAALQEQIQELEQKLWDAEAFSAEAQSDLSEKRKELSAMDWFWRIQRLYSRGSIRSARELARQFEANGLQDALPDASYAGLEGNSPKAQYQELHDLLF